MLLKRIIILIVIFYTSRPFLSVFIILSCRQLSLFEFLSGFGNNVFWSEWIFEDRNIGKIWVFPLKMSQLSNTLENLLYVTGKFIILQNVSYVIPKKCIRIRRHHSRNYSQTLRITQLLTVNLLYAS